MALGRERGALREARAARAASGEALTQVGSQAAIPPTPEYSRTGERGDSTPAREEALDRLEAMLAATPQSGAPTAVAPSAISVGPRGAEPTRFSSAGWAAADVGKGGKGRQVVMALGGLGAALREIGNAVQTPARDV